MVSLFEVSSSSRLSTLNQAFRMAIRTTVIEAGCLLFSCLSKPFFDSLHQTEDNYL